MKDTDISEKQLAAAVFTALLSPLMRVVPRAPVILAGKAAWLSALPALPPLFLLAAVVTSLRRDMEPGEGMPQLILRILTPWPGRLLLLLYGGWFLVYGGFILRSGAERLAAAVYQQSSPEPFMLVMLALCLAAALGTTRAAVRAAAVLRGALLGVLGLVLLLSLPGISPKNLFPVSAADAPGVVRGAYPIAAVGGAAALFTFLRAGAERGAWKRLLPTLLLFAGLASVLCFWSAGVFGARLTARLSYPFFTMIRDVTLFSIAQRIEAVVIALWVFADFAICSLLLRCAHEALRTIFALPEPDGLPMLSLRRGRFLLWLETAALWFSAKLLSATPERFLLWSERLAPLVMCAFSYGGFFLLWLVGKLRRKKI